MVRLFYQVFAALALVSGSAADIECITTDDYFGGPGGHRFIDKVDRDTNTTGVVLRYEERLDAIGIIVGGDEMNLHGGNGGTRYPIDLEGKRIIAMEVHRAKESLHTKVVFVKFTVKDGPSFQGGSEDDSRKKRNIKVFEAPVEGGYLIGFVGRAQDEVDALGGIWIDPECAKRHKNRKRKRSYDDDDDNDNDDDDDNDGSSSSDDDKE